MVELIKKAAVEAVEASKPAGIVFGTVVAVNPLKISVEQKLPLEEEDLILTDNVIDYDTELSFNDPTIEQLVKVGDNPIAKNAILTKNPQTPTETTTPVILEGQLKFMNKIKHKITIYNALKIGERVLMLRVQGGQQYVVLNRWR